jgi:hypothetical protein
VAGTFAGKCQPPFHGRRLRLLPRITLPATAPILGKDGEVLRKERGELRRRPECPAGQCAAHRRPVWLCFCGNERNLGSTSFPEFFRPASPGSPLIKGLTVCCAVALAAQRRDALQARLLPHDCPRLKRQSPEMLQPKRTDRPVSLHHCPVCQHPEDPATSRGLRSRLHELRVRASWGMQSRHRPRQSDNVGRCLAS